MAKCSLKYMRCVIFAKCYETDWWGKQILKASSKNKASLQGRGCTQHTCTVTPLNTVSLIGESPWALHSTRHPSPPPSPTKPHLLIYIIKASKLVKPDRCLQMTDFCFHILISKQWYTFIPRNKCHIQIAYQCSILKVKLFGDSFFLLTKLVSPRDSSFSSCAASSLPDSLLPSSFRLRPRGITIDYKSTVWCKNRRQTG